MPTKPRSTTGRGEYHRPVFDEVLARAHEPRRFIQVLAGPRQVGKTTLARQVMAAIGVPGHFASADAPDPEDVGWIYTQWAIGRQAAASGGRAGGVLVLDEVQKIRHWADIVKQLWDEDTASRTPLRVMILGSSPLLVKQGLSDSLAGRFEVIRVTHWTFGEMRDAFGWDLETFLVHGGYPGAAPLVGSHERWEAYLLDSLVETSLARDILLLNRVEKPRLLRQLFRLAATSSGEVVSFTSMLDRLTDAGNTVTLAHYLDLLGGAGMVTGVQKHTGGTARRRASSPRLLALNTGLVTATARATPADATADPILRHRLVTTAVGAHLAAHADPEDLAYWREGAAEVDWVVQPGKLLRGTAAPVAIEVRSGLPGRSSGLAAFVAGTGARPLIVGDGGVPLDAFLGAHPRDWLS